MPLVGFAGTVGETVSGLPFTLVDYLELVEWSGRPIRTYRRGTIAAGVPPILAGPASPTEPSPTPFFDPLPDYELDAWGS